MKHGSTCGRFSCGEAEICRLQTRDMWFDGTVISVVAEALFQAAGVKAQACHIGPHVLHAVRRILDHPGKIQIREIEVASILRQTSMVTDLLWHSHLLINMETRDSAIIILFG